MIAVPELAPPARRSGVSATHHFARSACSRAVNRIYSFFFLSTVIGILVWLYLNRPAVYRRVRNALGLSTLIAIGIFALFPMAPPRLTAGKQHDRQPRPGRVPARVREPIRGAAQPAHRLVVTGRLGHVEKPAPCPGAFFAIVPASVMMIAVVATGNHYWLDGVVGAAICLGAVMSTGPRPDPVSTPALSVPVPTFVSGDAGTTGAGSKHPHPALRLVDLYVPRPPARSGFYIVLGIPGRAQIALLGMAIVVVERPVPVTAAAQPIDLHHHLARDDRRRARHRRTHVCSVSAFMTRSSTSWARPP